MLMSHFQGGGGSNFLYILLNENPNDVLTTCKAIMEASVSGFLYCARAEFVKCKQNKGHGGRCQCETDAVASFSLFDDFFFFT